MTARERVAEFLRSRHPSERGQTSDLIGGSGLCAADLRELLADRDALAADLSRTLTHRGLAAKYEAEPARTAPVVSTQDEADQLPAWTVVRVMIGGRSFPQGKVWRKGPCPGQWLDDNRGHFRREISLPAEVLWMGAA